MQDHNLQLFDAGNVRQISRSHKRGAYTAPRTRQCAHIDAQGKRCSQSARRVQGAKYCDEHATARNYETNKAPVETRTCVCGRTYRAKKRLASAATQAWDEFCPDCHNNSPLTLEQVRNHNVSADLVRKWLTAGSKLRCDVCARTLTRRNKASNPVIDHDHGCCKGGNSCGACVRCIVCIHCNTRLGHIENTLAAGLLDRILEILRRN
jgi:hypothetical protein